MKKFITSKNIIQLVLSVIAFISFGACREIGNEYRYGGYKYAGSKFKLQNGLGRSILSTPVTSGYNGGALGMGFICASCVIGIVFIETSKK